MNLGDLTLEVGNHLLTLALPDGETPKVFSLDTGDIYLRSATGEVFHLLVSAIDPVEVSFIDEEDWL